MHLYTLTRRQFVPRPLDEVFHFFSQASNLEALTPSWLHFRILTPQPILMQAGAEIEYSIRMHGIPLHWRTLIERWQPGVEFVDVQIQGPYRLWRHTHTFEACGSGVNIADIIDYALPFGWLGRAAHAVKVKRDLDTIFDYRREQVAKLLG